MLLPLPASLVAFLQASLLYSPLAHGAYTALGATTTSARAFKHAQSDSPNQVSWIGKIQTIPTVVYKPRSVQFIQKTRHRSLHYKECQAQDAEGPERLEWNAVQVQGPNVEDRHTLAQLARMAGNAYALPGQKNWYEVDPSWNNSFPFGWEEGEGFRGQVFLSSDNNTVVLSIKGTTLQGPTSKLDKYNDNLLFSCCCARHAWVLKTVCDCFGSGWQCDDRCLTEALVEDSLFYSVGTKLVDDLLHIYPTANIWLVGHSLGGALASLLGATYGLPAVAFESPGERMAAHRLHLPLPPATNDSTPTSPSSFSSTDLIHSIIRASPLLSFFLPTPRIPRAPPPPSPLSGSITHVYHTADPIPFGTCSGLYSACASAGYALETKCHLGKSIILDTVNKMKWLVDVRKHVVREVVRLLDIPEEGGVDWGDDDDGDEGGDPGEGDGDNDDDDDGKDPTPPCRDWDWCLQGRDEMGVLASVGNSFTRGWGQLWGLNFPGKGKGGKDKKDSPRKVSNRVPRPIAEDDCVDCHRWEFGSFKDTWVGATGNVSDADDR